jgi:hypothetical protein
MSETRTVRPHGSVRMVFASPSWRFGENSLHGLPGPEAHPWLAVSDGWR